MPVVGLLAAGAPDAYDAYRTAFRQALSEAGFIEGRNVAIEYRWAIGRFDLMPDLVADLLRRRVTVIVISGSTAAVLAARLQRRRSQSFSPPPMTPSSLVL